MTEPLFSSYRPDLSAANRATARWAWLLAVVALLSANLPYLLGILWTPAGASFTGLLHNQDDSAVYLSWIRQATEGNLFLQNRFTTEPQKGLAFNSFFYVLGTIGGWTHLSPPVVYGGARVLFGALLLWALWHLVTTLLVNDRARLLAFAFLCFASGFGLGSDFDPRLAYQQPIDRWQPEAITFLSLYFTPLFTAALALMAVFISSFYRAEQTGKKRHLVPACIAGFLLGNFHSYDILQLFACVCVYRVLSDLYFRKFTFRGYVHLALVGLAMLPTAAYQYWAITNEAVFHARVFDTSTLSPGPQWVLLGFGLPLILAFVAPFVSGANRKLAPDALRLALVWAVVAICISYARDFHGVPVSFQRKLLMGAHLPLCILGATVLAAATESLAGSLPAMIAVFTVLLTMPSNLRFVLGDIARLPQNTSGTQYRPYLTRAEAGALQFLGTTAKPGEAVLTCPDIGASRYGVSPFLPYLGVYIPAYSSASVYCAHWSETAQFEQKLSAETRFFRANTTDTERRDFLAENPSIHYIIYTHAIAAGLTDSQGEFIKNPATDLPYFVGIAWDEPVQYPDFLRPVYRQGEITVFAVVQGRG